MNSMRKFLCVLTAVVLAAFALPSFAAQPTKIFSLKMSPATVNTSPVTLTATYANTTPNGNSVINTVILTPPSGIVVTGTSFPQGANRVTCPATAPNLVGQQVPVPPNSICVSGIPSVMKAGCSPPCQWQMTVTVTLDLTACAPYTWTAQAFAGNSFAGDVFAYQSAQSSPTTSGPPPSGFAQTFSAQPQSAVAGSAIPPPVAVTLSNSCGPVNGGNVTLTVASGPACTVPACLSQNTATTGANGIATFPNLSISTIGTYTLKATTTATGFSDATSNPFTIFMGDLLCGDNLNQSFTNPLNLQDWQPGYATGFRGKFNKDGSGPCIKIPYTFTNDLLSDDTAHIVWDVNVQRYAIFSYSVNGEARLPQASDPPGFPSAVRPQVGWVVESGAYVLVPGLACLGTNPPDDMPTPYGTLNQPVAASTGGTADTIFVNAASLPAAPFPIVVGGAGGPERMQVNSVSGASSPFMLSVTRGTGVVPTGLATPSHLINDPVMTTPLPIIPVDAAINIRPAYAAGNIAHTCVQEYGVTAFGNGMVYDFATFIDGDDAGVKLGP